MKNASGSIDRGSQDNPYQPPSIGEAGPFELKNVLSNLTARSIPAMSCLTLGAAVLLAWTAVFDIQQFISMSHLLLALGIVTSAMSLIARNWPGLTLGLSALGVCLFCDYVIHFVTAGRTLLSRSALHADELLRPIVLLYACVAVPVSAIVFLRNRR